MRGVVIYGATCINEMRANHKLRILETMILGHGYNSTLLLSLNLKGSKRFILEVSCGVLIQGMAVEANVFSKVSDYLKEKYISLEKPLQDFNITPFFDNGVLSVTRYLENTKFTSQVKLEQRSSALNLA